jgi:hypothetical protein
MLVQVLDLELVRFGSQLMRCEGFVLVQHHTQLLGKALQEQEQEEHVRLLPSGAQFQHLRKKLSGLPAAKRFQLHEFLNAFKKAQLLRGEELFFESGVGVLIIRILHKVHAVAL